MADVDEKQFVPSSLTCGCCKGFPFDCEDQTCQELGTCGCIAIFEVQTPTADDFQQFMDHDAFDPSQYDGDPETWVPGYRNCGCCKGYIFNCDDPICRDGGICLCTQGEPTAPAPAAPIGGAAVGAKSDGPAGSRAASARLHAGAKEFQPSASALAASAMGAADADVTSVVRMPEVRGVTIAAPPGSGVRIERAQSTAELIAQHVRGEGAPSEPLRRAALVAREPGDVAALARVLVDGATAEGLSTAQVGRAVALIQILDPLVPAPAKTALQRAMLGEIQTKFTEGASDFSTPEFERLCRFIGSAYSASLLNDAVFGFVVDALTKEPSAAAVEPLRAIYDTARAKYKAMADRSEGAASARWAKVEAALADRLAPAP